MTTRTSDGRKALEILGVIGTEAMLALAENFAGTRLYVPHHIKADHQIAVAIGLPAARKLSEHYAPDVIPVPLCRELRAERYREQGLSNAKVAIRLGVTENAICRIYGRLRRDGVELSPKGSRVE